MSSALLPATSSSPFSSSFSIVISPAMLSVASSVFPVRITSSVQSSVRSERHDLRNQPPMSYKEMMARAFSAVIDPRSYDEAMRSKNSKQWEIEMEAEIASIVKNDC